MFEPLTNMIGLLGKPEAMVRQEALQLDEPTSLYGSYGKYYVTRQIANMVLDSDLGIMDAQRAIVDQKGPAWDAAMDRVMTEQSLRIPGIAPAMAIKNGAKPIEVVGAMVAGAFSCFPVPWR
jgi:hypothetical protein